MNPTRILKQIFTGILIARLLFPFLNNPMESLFSDAQRHMNNAVSFVHPNIFNAIDPKLYQIFMYVLRLISNNGENYAIVALVVGLQCAGFAYCWMRFCKEILPKKHAYILAILVALVPTTWTVFAYFMNETIMLNMLALSFWLSFRAMRKKDFSSGLCAFISMLLLAHSKLTAAPIGLFLFPLIYFSQVQKKKFFVTACSIFIITSLATGIYSYRVLKVFTPFYFTKMNQIYYLCDSKKFHFDVKNVGGFIFGSPAYYTDIMEPLYDYIPPREEKVYSFAVDLNNGTKDWDDEIEKLSSNYTIRDAFARKVENLVFLLFSPDWPESSKTDPILYKKIAFYSHWIWCPLITFVFIAGFFSRSPEKHAFVLAVTLAMIILFVMQSAGVMEGRYRKVIEPLVITCTYLLVYNRKSASPNAIKYTIWFFIMNFLNFEFVQKVLRKLRITRSVS